MATKKFTRLQLTKKSAIKPDDLSATILSMKKFIPNLSDFSVIVSTGTGTVQANTCKSHSCDGYEPRPPSDPGDCPGHSSCETEACTTHTCSGHDCETNGCSAHACSDTNFACGAHTGGVVAASKSSKSTSYAQLQKILAELGSLSKAWSGISLTVNPER